VKKKLAFVLGGGGARGALQVGALRALLEAGYTPDIMIGTSIGAANAAFLALRGAQLGSIPELIKVWREASYADLLPANYLWLTVRSLFNRINAHTSHRMRDFFVSHGINPDLRFGDVPGVKLYTVAADLNSGRPVILGKDPDECLLDGVLASTALPPWIAPIQKDDRLLVDGGFLSNLPVEPALQQQVTEIIALDLWDPRATAVESQRFGVFLEKVINAANQRQTELELALAAACDVPVHYINLRGKEAQPLWDFSRSEELIVAGYEATSKEIESWKPAHKSSRRLPWGRH
jgi:NTE family protein